MLKNPKSYIFSSLTASVDCPLGFHPIPEDNPSSKIGHLVVPADAKFLINDGQHRKAAIELALKEKPELGRETISVVLYIDAGLRRSQQMFADLNKYSVKPSASLNILYDHKDIHSNFILEIVNEIPIFGENIEMEKTTISPRSDKLFTLSSIYRATKTLVGNLNTEQDDKKGLVIDFWCQVTEYMKDWNRYLSKEAQAYELRKDSVAVHGLALQSISNVGLACIESFPTDWRSKLKTFEKIDWNRSNGDWEGRALIGGRLSISGTNIILTSNYLKQKMSIPLSPQENIYEEEYRRRVVG
jgi:DNA sulfur modification protein DndB